MTTTNGGPSPEKVPQLNVLTQYTKDFSFENPNAPRSLTPPQQQPAINIQINVNVRGLAENDYEVELKIEGKADSAGTVLFGFDLTYAGVFRIQNVAQESVHPLVMIECPRLLFPFAREIVQAGDSGAQRHAARRRAQRRADRQHQAPAQPDAGPGAHVAVGRSGAAQSQLRQEHRATRRTRRRPGSRLDRSRRHRRAEPQVGSDAADHEL